jgi:hypothetical protein
MSDTAFTPSENTAEVADSTVAVQVSDDKMTAYIIISGPLNGGREIAVEDAVAELEANAVAAEIDHGSIASAITGKVYNQRVPVAKGTKPINGIDGAITYNYECTGVLSAKKNERDEMDYKDLGLVKNILSGTTIATITHPTEGEDGIDVCGVHHKAMPGKAAKFLVGKGARLTEDERAIVAEFDGNLRWSKDHFTVEEVLLIGEDVGPATGNVDFLGDVQVKGNVLEGFTVKSKKNILINGTANNATLIAEGNIDIKMGSVNSELTSKGDIKVGFCENSTIDCGGDLTSASFVACDVFCHGTTFAISGKGIMIGGKMTCLKGMVFNTVGSESYTKTRLTLGNGAILAEEKLELEKKEAKLTEEIGKLVQLIEMLNAAKKKNGSIPRQSEDMLATAIRNRFKNSAEIKQITKRIAEIEMSFLDNAYLNIEIRKSVWPGVTVRIGALSKKIEQKNDRCRISIDSSGDISINAIVGSI